MILKSRGNEDGKIGYDKGISSDPSSSPLLTSFPLLNSKYEGDDKFFPKDAEDKIALDTETTLVDVSKRKFEDVEQRTQNWFVSSSLLQTWKAMIELQKKGRVTSIGVSNFTQPMLEGIIKATGVVPAVNQIEAHPVLPQDDLVEYSKSKNIHITAYSPLGNPGES